MSGKAITGDGCRVLRGFLITPFQYFETTRKVAFIPKSKWNKQYATRSAFVVSVLYSVAV